MRKIALSALCLFCSMNVSAVPSTLIQTTELPSDIQSCFQNLQCSSGSYTGSSWWTSIDTAGAAAFSYTEQGVDKWLLRYDLLTPPGTVAGTAWVSARNSYDIAGSDAHAFTLYYDDPGNGYLGSPPFTLTLNDTDLSDGSAFRLVMPNFEDPNNSVEAGNLGISPSLFLCLATGCGAAANFNLLHMSYSNGLFGFNPQDTRGLLFSQDHWYDCGYQDCGSYSQSQSLYVHAVPLPASALLFVSGLAGGMLGVRRQRSKSRA